MKRLFKKYWYFLVMAVLLAFAIPSVVAYFDMKSDYEEAIDSLQSSTLKVLELNRQMIEWREEYKPVEFESTDDFCYFVDQLHLSKLDPPSLERAIMVQDEALKKGKLVHYQIVINSVTRQTEFWNVAKIGNEIYCIEPVLNIVTLLYPGNRWR